MHFFFTYEAQAVQHPDRPWCRASRPGITNLLPADAAAQLGPSNLPFKENLYFGKIDWEPTDRDRFELSAQVRKETSTAVSATSPRQPPAAYETNNDDKRFDLRWQHSGDAYFNELLVYPRRRRSTRRLANNSAMARSIPTRSRTLIRPSIATGAANPLATQNKGQKGPSLQDDLTFNDLEWHGDHVIKMGVKYKDITLDAAGRGRHQCAVLLRRDADGPDATPYKAFFTKPVMARAEPECKPRTSNSASVSRTTGRSTTS